MVADLVNKTFVITGATSGIGYATAQILLSRGANVVGVGRNPGRCEQADATLKSLNLRGKIDWCPADLSLTSNVHTLAQVIQDKLAERSLDGLDGLVNNAGTVPFQQTFTSEGLDTQWAVNHMAPFILSIKLLPVLHPGTTTRIVTISSNSHYRGRMHWDDIQLIRHYAPLRAYEYTKLCNVLFTVELDRRLRGSGRRAFSADPGLVNTNIGMKSKSPVASLAWSIRRLGGMPAHESAVGIVYLLAEPSIQAADEIFWKQGKSKAPNPIARDGKSAQRLWDISMEYSGMTAVEVENYFHWE